MTKRSTQAGKRAWTRLRVGRLDRREATWLLIGLGLCVMLFAFVSLAGEVTEGDTQAFDTKILRALRDPSDLAKPRGPAWLEGPLLDLTAIGGPTVLGLVVISVAGFLVLQTRYRTAAVVVITMIGGELLDNVMKQFFNRPRPTVVPHMREVYSSSFPSGHAMESAIVYLTLAAILMRASETRVTKMYILGIAVLLTLLVGVSRVYLGVHYPTDVIGGWIVGFMWALICWLAARRFERAAHLEAEKTRTE